jgi:hypothetical protein
VLGDPLPAQKAGLALIPGARVDPHVR